MFRAVAQWLDEGTGVDEAHRVLRLGGRWAGWWSHARADNQDWFDEYWSTIELACRGAHRDQRNIDGGAILDAAAVFDAADRRNLVIGAVEMRVDPVRPHARSLCPEPTRLGGSASVAVASARRCPLPGHERVVSWSL